VKSVVKSMSSKVKLSSTGLIGGVKRYNQYKDLDAGRDIVVATPGRVLQFKKASKGD